MPVAQIRPRVLLSFLGACVLFVLGVIAIVRFIDAHPDSRWRYPLIVLPLVVVFGSAVAAWLSVSGMDELHRRMHTEALAIGFLASFLIVSTYSFLLFIGLAPPVFSFAPTMVFCWIGGLGVTMWRYR